MAQKAEKNWGFTAKISIMSKKVLKNSCKQFFKNMKNGHNIRPVHKNTGNNEITKNTEYSQDFIDALKEARYVLDHPDEFEWFTDTKEFITWILEGTV